MLDFFFRVQVSLIFFCVGLVVLLSIDSVVMILFYFPRTSSSLQIFSDCQSTFLNLKTKMVDSKSAWTVNLGFFHVSDMRSVKQPFIL